MIGEDGADIPQPVQGQGELTTAEVGRGLAVPAPADVQSPASSELKRQDEMDLDTARAVLQSLVDIHEESISEDAFDMIGEYSPEQIRQAFEVVATSLMREHGGMLDEHAMTVLPPGSVVQNVEKETPQGKLSLSLVKSTISNNVSMGLHPYDHSVWSLLVNEVSLDEPTGNERWFTGFADYRSGKKEYTLDHLDQNYSLAGFQQMVRGTRWMSANMLDWQNPATIMPEQLDNRALPPSPSPSPNPTGS